MMRGEGRKVLLIIDNTTAYRQPMDQGILVSFKVRYRGQWAAFMLR